MKLPDAEALCEQLAAEYDAQAAQYEAVSLEEIERRHILATLQHTDWNKSQAAQILGIERSTLDRKIKLYDLKR